VDRRRLRYWATAAALGIALALPAAAQAVPLTVTVNDPGDADDLDAPGGPYDTVCDSSAAAGLQCTLRAAIRTTSNNVNPAETDTVNFAVPGNVITITTSLVNNPQPVTFNGCASPAATQPCTEVRTTTASINGFNSVGPGVTIRGLAMTGFVGAINASNGSTGLVVQGNWLGLHLDGSPGPNQAGVGTSGSGGTIGGDTPNERNVIGSNGVGISITGDTNVVTGNHFGVNAAGDSRPNNVGIYLDQQGAMNTAQDNEIGSDDPAGYNLISNSSGGVAIRLEDDGVDSNEILGNIGTDNGGDFGNFIDLGPLGAGNLLTGPNRGIEAPAIASATTTLVTGAGAAPSAQIRVFRRAGTQPGTIDGVAGTATANGAGNWSVPVSGVAAGNQVLATQTTTMDDTSELSAPVSAVGPPVTTPPPSTTPPSGNPECDALRKKLKKAKTKRKKRKLRKKLRKLGC
jgi:hypothetical protein